VKALQQETKYIIPLLLLIMALNTVDWAMTQAALASRLAIELNPLVATLFSHGSFAALLYKTLIVGACCTILFIFRRNRAMRVTTWIVAGWFCLLIVYQIVGRVFLT